jgi:hypothetical protein
MEPSAEEPFPQLVDLGHIDLKHADLKHADLELGGMTCASCAPRIERSLSRWTE